MIESTKTPAPGVALSGTHIWKVGLVRVGFVPVTEPAPESDKVPVKHGFAAENGPVAVSTPLADNDVNVPGAGVVPPIVVLSMVPPEIVTPMVIVPRAMAPTMKNGLLSRVPLCEWGDTFQFDPVPPPLLEAGSVRWQEPTDCGWQKPFLAPFH